MKIINFNGKQVNCYQTMQEIQQNCYLPEIMDIFVDIPQFMKWASIEDDNSQHFIFKNSTLYNIDGEAESYSWEIVVCKFSDIDTTDSYIVSVINENGYFFEYNDEIYILYSGMV